MVMCIINAGGTMRLTDRRRVVKTLEDESSRLLHLERSASATVRKAGATKRDVQKFNQLHLTRGRRISRLPSTLLRHFPKLKRDPEMVEIVSELSTYAYQAREAVRSGVTMEMVCIFYSKGMKIGEPNHLQRLVNKLKRRKTSW